jgi:hypothetical protein
LLPDDRYLYVEAKPDALYPIARGLRDWKRAIADRSVRVFGDPALIGALPGWFLPVAAESQPERVVAVAAAQS